jgi:hypothetical protein
VVSLLCFLVHRGQSCACACEIMTCVWIIASCRL